MGEIHLNLVEFFLSSCQGWGDEPYASHRTHEFATYVQHRMVEATKRIPPTPRCALAGPPPFAQ